MLTKAMRKYVLSEDKSGYDKGKQGNYNTRLKNYSKLAIEDLTLIMEKLPESDLEKLFNAKTMSPFFRALFKIKVTNKEQKYSEEIKAKRQRLFSLSKSLLNIFEDGQFVSSVLPIPAKEGKSAKFLKVLYDYETDSSIT
jgi:hypothetical protein